MTTTMHLEIPAAALIAEGRCTPQCLVAADADRNGSCRCRCRGVYHGSLGDTPIRTTVPGLAWHEHRHGYLLSEVPEIQPHSREFRATYQRALQLGRGIAGIHRTKNSKWSAMIDLRPARPWPVNSETAELVQVFLGELQAQRHAAGSIGPPEHLWAVHGLGAAEEASVIVQALLEAAYNNTAGIRRLVHGLGQDLLRDVRPPDPCICPDCGRRAGKDGAGHE